MVTDPAQPRQVAQPLVRGGPAGHTHDRMSCRPAIGYPRTMRPMAAHLGRHARFPVACWTWTQLAEEDLAVSDRMPEPENAGAQPGSEPDMSHTAEFAKLRAVMRASEKHREGGVDPDLEDTDADPGAET